MKKTLARSSTDRKISGVCGGIAEYLNIDSAIIRVAFVLTIFAGGFGLLLYIIAAIIMPMDYEVGRNHTNYQTQNTSSAENTAQSSNENTATDDSNSEIKNEFGTNLNNQDQKKSTILNPATIIGAILVIIGIIFMVNIFFPSFDFGVVIALCIVAAGVLIIVKGGK
jgi:phage shock protein C